MEYFKVDAQYLLQGPDVFKPQVESIDLQQWNEIAFKLWQSLKDDPNWPIRIHFFYLPLVYWVRSIREKATQKTSPVIIGINGPQGCGKSTLTRFMVDLLAQFGFRSVSLSIDDFYLTHESQVHLASQFSTNPLLQQRGYPGTHDIGLGIEIFKNLKNIANAEFVDLPVYDKSKHSGQGDRLSISQWKRVRAPLDFVLVEGWMLGFTKVPETVLPDEHFRVINECLAEYKGWTSSLDGFIQLVPEKTSYIVNWRVEAEEKMRNQGMSAMSKAEILNYINKFLPAYDIYLPHLLKYPPIRDPYLQLTLLSNRLPDLEKNSARQNSQI